MALVHRGNARTLLITALAIAGTITLVGITLALPHHHATAAPRPSVTRADPAYLAPDALRIPPIVTTALAAAPGAAPAPAGQPGVPAPTSSAPDTRGRATVAAPAAAAPEATTVPHPVVTVPTPVITTVPHPVVTVPTPVITTVPHPVVTVPTPTPQPTP